MSEFKRVDIAKLESFVTESAEAITEFSKIREEFNRINNTLMQNWDGMGKSAFSEVAQYITEKVGDIQGILTEINENVLKDLIEQYNAVDRDLAEYNNNAGKAEEGN